MPEVTPITKIKVDTYLVDSLALSPLTQLSQVVLKKLRLLGVSLGAVMCAGCAPVTHHPDIVPPDYPIVSRTTPSSSCEALGPLNAEADCACFDKMSYLRVQAKASHNLASAARRKYPEADVVQISEVDVFLNSAVARGVAYRCDSAANES